MRCFEIGHVCAALGRSAFSGGRVYFLQTAQPLARMTPDRQLLQEFVRQQSQAAFRQLVERHSHWLYSVCVRRLGDSASAEDATQAVFLALAQHAPSLSNEPTISPWLHQAARFCSLK